MMAISLRMRDTTYPFPQSSSISNSAHYVLNKKQGLFVSRETLLLSPLLSNVYLSIYCQRGLRIRYYHLHD